MTQAMATTQANALAEQLRGVKPYLAELVPEPQRFATTLMVLARRTPELLRCDAASVVGAALVCAQLDLEPGPAEHVWLIPRRNKNTATIDCTLMLGYKGMKALAERHPAIASVRTGTVCTNDTFSHSAQPPAIHHVPAHGNRGEAILWYAVAERADGAQPHIAVLDRADVDKRRKHSASSGSGPWVTHFDEMARKSAIRALWSELPSSLDMQRAAAIDDLPGVVTPKDLGVGREEIAENAPKQLADGRLLDEETGEILPSDPAAVEPSGQAREAESDEGPPPQTGTAQDPIDDAGLSAGDDVSDAPSSAAQGAPAPPPQPQATGGSGSGQSGGDGPRASTDPGPAPPSDERADHINAIGDALDAAFGSDMRTPRRQAWLLDVITAVTGSRFTKAEDLTIEHLRVMREMAEDFAEEASKQEQIPW